MKSHLGSINVFFFNYYYLFQNNVTEETRLAVTVHRIDEEASVVPRGAFITRPHGLVQTNRSFGGKLVAYLCQWQCNCGLLKYAAA